jgi:signal transduction histidine kinase
MTPSPPESIRVSVFKYTRALAPVVIFWCILIGWLAYLLQSRMKWGVESDRANLQEWIEEARIFRKTLPELVREYLAMIDDYQVVGEENENLQRKAEEIAEQLRALADPLRMFQGQLPLFVEVYKLQVGFTPPEGDRIRPIGWESPVPKPRQNEASLSGRLNHPIVFGKNGPRAFVYCEYRLHAFNKVQRDEEQRQTIFWAVAGVVIGGSILGIVWVLQFLKRERVREFSQLQAETQLEHAENLVLAEKLRAQDAELAKEELDRKLLQQSLEAARQESRAAEAEKDALQLRSQLYASIGIMAGSYAHNIKNLLVRPNDLLNRCLEGSDLKTDQSSMLQEVKITLGTVTERLQQILRTVRRDPSRAELTRIDLNVLLRDTEQTWREMGLEKWKLVIEAHPASEPLWIKGDLSHLQQAIENLLFNARDATFEMRNHVRDTARAIKDAATRRQAILDAAAWKGSIALRSWREGDFAILEVKDNGIGMTEEVRQNCIQTHFTTKRDNALYEGYNAGMGLGLSFVVVVLEHHQATLEIESQPQQGACFRARFPLG